MFGENRVIPGPFMEVVQKGIYYFDRKPFVAKPWNEEMEINTVKIFSLPVWVQLPGLYIKYWGGGADSLSKIGSMLGIPIKMDRYTVEKSMLRYARLLIDINLGDDSPNYIEFANDKDVLVRQPITYEWKPIQCTPCKMYGHTAE